MRRAIAIGAAVLGVVAAGALLARERLAAPTLTAATLPPRAAHLTPLESPGAARFTCEHAPAAVNAQLTAFDVPPGTHTVTYRFGEPGGDARELSALLDGHGRALAFDDDGRHLRGDSSLVSLRYLVGRREDGALSGTRTAETLRTHRDGPNVSHGATSRSDSLDAADLARAAAVIAWLQSHRCE